ncbi:TVP38/TMEM64 family protein, partial [Halobacterium sp. PCN9]|nr:TVP38/TMEM64 family protein [Halobacterium bonnevillei]
MKRYAAGVLVAAVVVVAVVVRPDRALGVLRTALASPWSPAILVGLYAVRPLLGWPISLLSALVGFKYGVFVGVPVALAGAVGTSLLPYLAGRFAPQRRPPVRPVRGRSTRYFDAAGADAAASSPRAS